MSRSLAERAVACKGWRWMPGMLDLASEFGGRRILAILADGTQVLSAHETIGAFPEQTTVRTVAAFTCPDLDDPGTVGCLLALVCEAHPRASVDTSSGGGEGMVEVWRHGAHGAVTVYSANRGTRSIAHALVEALEAAPT